MSKDRSFSTAIHILTALAYRAPDLLTSEALAQSLQTNPGLVRRTLLKLSNAGFVHSIKGTSGGNQLALPAQKISLGAVYNAVKSGPVFKSFDKSPHKACVVSCNMGAVLDEIYAEVDQKLTSQMERIKISDILAKVK